MEAKSPSFIGLPLALSPVPGTWMVGCRSRHGHNGAVQSRESLPALSALSLALVGQRESPLGQVVLQSHAGAWLFPADFWL